MNKEQFKARWESNDEGGGITLDDIANCAIEWGISNSPRTSRIDNILYMVLKAAKVVDCESYNTSAIEGMK